MSRSRNQIGSHFEDKVCEGSCLACGASGFMVNLNEDEHANYPHVDVRCYSCNSVFQVKASSQKYNIKHIKNSIYQVNMFRERIVNEALDLYGDNYRIIGIEYSEGKKGKMDIERMVLSTRIRKVIRREGGVDAVEIVGRRII